MELNIVYKEIEKKMEHSLEAFARDLRGIRTGRASASLLDGIKISCYGTFSPLRQVASISTPDSQMIMVQPWDKSIIPDVERAILESELGLNPSNDGNAVRIPIPPLTEERRRELVKIVKKNSEESKVAVRNIRREGIDTIKRMEKNKEISEDGLRKAQDHIQKITDKFIKNVDDMLSKKENEILQT